MKKLAFMLAALALLTMLAFSSALAVAPLALLPATNSDQVSIVTADERGSPASIKDWCFNYTLITTDAICACASMLEVTSTTRSGTTYSGAAANYDPAARSAPDNATYCLTLNNGRRNANFGLQSLAVKLNDDLGVYVTSTCVPTARSGTLSANNDLSADHPDVTVDTNRLSGAWPHSMNGVITATMTEEFDDCT